MIRGVFDSKFNEYLLFKENIKQFTSFTDFAYAWIGRFYFNKKTRKIDLVDEINN
jgi:hypothetical protein